MATAIANAERSSALLPVRGDDTGSMLARCFGTWALKRDMDSRWTRYSVNMVNGRMAETM